ncbi:hypothetical protein GCM10010275_36280 [Streptomyces litmocidini]|nr:hypothetical protein GCM10010275_36280 [Streptomyces litmocidini]
MRTVPRPARATGVENGMDHHAGAEPVIGASPDEPGLAPLTGPASGPGLPFSGHSGRARWLLPLLSVKAFLRPVRGRVVGGGIRPPSRIGRLDELPKPAASQPLARLEDPAR